MPMRATMPRCRLRPTIRDLGARASTLNDFDAGGWVIVPSASDDG